MPGHSLSRTKATPLQGRLFTGGPVIGALWDWPKAEVLVMSERQSWGGSIRKLWPTDTDKFRDHLLRLDKTNRRMRFAHGVSDAFIEDYAGAHGRDGRRRFRLFRRRRGAGSGRIEEARRCLGPGGGGSLFRRKALQEQGMGTELMGLVIRAARNRGIQHLCVSCLAENGKMQRNRPQIRGGAALRVRRGHRRDRSRWPQLLFHSCRSRRRSFRLHDGRSRSAPARGQSRLTPHSRRIAHACSILI